ncbi:SDR family NAD(P)-dependent oxidoreductase [Nitratireductor sp. ZSWI3]|uniref:SDR family NAD(P)-dependent oxidoreductase n=1 Tax=Nitratireductor sp. ZSWI3 TaxID=2966359 RepID=UPI00214F7922|nr:SDR family NAD(P)-dependent oxidoreductase [Nitratireductor sp. ZSWI3]MCR4266975.1 SDR family oxidoreductase [Nitratireductor sp. ZSWI3]
MTASRHALVTGGGSGVGEAIALALAEAGIDVTVCGRRAEPLEKVSAGHARIHAMTADVTDEASVKALYETAEAERGPFDIVIANAGIASSAPAHRTTLEDWNRIVDVNLTGAFLTVKPALQPMAKRGSGRIVFIASVAGLRGYAYVAPYVASKHGVIGLMRALSVELVKTGVTVNAICPGYVETEMLEESIARVVEKTGRSREEARKGFIEANPHGRLIKPREVAAAALWLVSPEAASVTGQSISISGGETW